MAEERRGDVGVGVSVSAWCRGRHVNKTKSSRYYQQPKKDLTAGCEQAAVRPVSV